VTDLLAPPTVLMRPRFVWQVARNKRSGKARSLNTWSPDQAEAVS
jgi:hypothetical protein